jgi:hypothetical protein
MARRHPILFRLKRPCDFFVTRELRLRYIVAVCQLGLTLLYGFADPDDIAFP